MAESDEKMVLRTVYLPREVDDQLRLIAFRSGTTKGDLVRSFVKNGLAGRDQATLTRKPTNKKMKGEIPLKSKPAAKGKGTAKITSAAKIA